MLGGMCGNWYKELRNLKHDKLSREYRDFFVPYKVPVRAKLPSDDASLEREIERQLHLKSEPLIYPGKLKSNLRYSLHDDRIPGASSACCKQCSPEARSKKCRWCAKPAFAIARSSLDLAPRDRLCRRCSPNPRDKK
jgi:hypothetical protein